MNVQTPAKPRVGLWDNGGAVYARKVERPHIVELRNWWLGTTHAVVMRSEREHVKLIDGQPIPEPLWPHMERLYAEGAMLPRYYQPRPQRQARPSICYLMQSDRVWYVLRT